MLLGLQPQDAVNNKATIIQLGDELAEPEDARARTAEDVNHVIQLSKQADLCIRQHSMQLIKAKKASDYLSHILPHSMKTSSEPNHYIRRLPESEKGFESWVFLRLQYSGAHHVGTHLLLRSMDHPSLHLVGQNSICSWIEDVARYESESGVLIDDHLKIAYEKAPKRGRQAQ